MIFSQIVLPALTTAELVKWAIGIIGALIVAWTQRGKIAKAIAPADEGMRADIAGDPTGIKAKLAKLDVVKFFGALPENLDLLKNIVILLHLRAEAKEKGDTEALSHVNALLHNAVEDPDAPSA